jgi:transposase-like protein
MAQPILNQPHFQDEDKAREYLEALRWNDEPVCPHCGSVGKHYSITGKSARKGLWKCADCREQFTVTVGTVFERSKIKLHIWLQAVHLVCASKNGMSSMELHRLLGVTQKTAWFMLHRIREAMKPDNGGLMGSGGGTVEADETYWGNSKRSKAADDLLAAAYEEDGAVDGVLQKLDGHGKLEFVIYDLIDDRSVKCEIKEELLSNALSNFNKRVEVIGTVKYRKDGMPVAIRASKIISFPDVSEIPSLIQMRELLSARKSA